jgi:hypothetical protein
MRARREKARRPRRLAPVGVPGCGDAAVAAADSKTIFIGLFSMLENARSAAYLSVEIVFEINGVIA